MEKHESEIKKENLSKAANFALQYLEKNLLPQLYYHWVGHTRDEVVQWAERLAKLEGLSDHERRLVVTAAYYHDIGWTEVKACTEAEYAKRLEHEELGADFARQHLPGFGYSRAEIDDICEIILATKLSSSPASQMERIIRDADLSSLGLGVDTFWRRGNDLRAEMGEFGILVSDTDWLQIEEDLLSRMGFYTDSARKLFDANRNAALQSVREKMVR